MEKKIAGYYVDVINISFHTTFDLPRHPETEIFIANALTLPGIVDCNLKRYSVEFELGFLFDVHSVKAELLTLFKTFYGPEELNKITTQDLAQRAAQRQIESLEDLEEGSLPNLLLSLMETNKGTSEA
jgi:hypothetical protein